MKHSILRMITVIAFLPSTLLFANDKPVLIAESATGILEKITSTANVIKFRCVPPNGDIYIVTLDSAASTLQIERPELWVITASPVHAHLIKEGTDHYSFNTGSSMDFYDFDLVLPRDTTKPTRFTLKGGAASLTCVSEI